MKQFIFSLITIFALSQNLKAQEKSADEKSLTSSPESVFPADTITPSPNQDTAIVRIGKKEVKVIGHDGGTEIRWGKDKHKKDHSGKFNGHWEGIEFGFNAFDKPDYRMYNVYSRDFMLLNQGKSMEFDFNFYELNIGLARSYVGLVSGMGLSFNNYR
ncbi:MAG: hypothetical protein Q8N05_15365, partial [Bacteroidota bacterium]|nr:hypothetical protein [Bacteroidota bacterium]